MDAHMMPDDEPQAMNLIVAQVQRMRADSGHFSALLVVPPEADAAGFVSRFAGRLGYIVIERRKEQQGARGTIAVERAGEVGSELLAVAPQP
jgi:hypothetical protein